MISQSRNEFFVVDSKFSVNDLNNVSGHENFRENTCRDYTSINLHLTPLKEDINPPISGIAKSHQQLIAQVSDEENIVIGIRPIDPKSTSIIESGEYSSKGLAIKAKSSDWGPHSGFIPVQQEFAKKSGREDSNKFNKHVQDSLNKGKVISVILNITPERVNELIQYGAIYYSNTKEQHGYQEIASVVDGEKIIFYLRKVVENNRDKFHVYHLKDDEIKPFYVIGDPKTEKAMTADYDIFSIIFPMSELEHYIKVTAMPTWEEWKSSVNYDELTIEQKHLYHDEDDYNKREGKYNGVINKKIKEINSKINKRLGLVDGMELIHHGADDANPVSLMKDNFPITFLLPEKLKGKNALLGTSESIDTYFHMNSQGAIIINDVEQLSNFQQLLINQSYRAPLNKRWSEGEYSQYFEPKRKISESFINGRLDIERKKSITGNFIDGEHSKTTEQLNTDALSLGMKKNTPKWGV